MEKTTVTEKLISPLTPLTIAVTGIQKVSKTMTKTMTKMMKMTMTKTMTMEKNNDNDNQMIAAKETQLVSNGQKSCPI